MQGKEQKIVIDGVTFQVAPFMSVEGLRLKAYLVRLLGPGLIDILGKLDVKDVKKSIADVPLDAIASGATKLLEQLDEDSFIALIERLFTNVIATWKVNNKSVSISFGNDFETAMQQVFIGKLFSVYELMYFVIKVNYPDFFSKVVGGIGKRIQKTPTLETEEGTSTTESETSETSES